jgi:hypothetical protein
MIFVVEIDSDPDSIASKKNVRGMPNIWYPFFTMNNNVKQKEQRMFRIESVEREGGMIDMLPLHLCYVEVWPTYQRLFRYPPRPNLVKVCNDHGETARLFRLLREQPQALLTALTRNVEGDLLPEVLCYQRLITAWHLS